MSDLQQRMRETLAVVAQRTAVEVEPTDEEIINYSVDQFSEGWSHPEVVQKVLDEFFSDPESRDEAEDLVVKAYDQFFKKQDAEIEATRAEVGQVADERNAAQAEADKHLVEKYDIAGRLGKDIDLSDKEKVAKLIKLHEEEEQQQDDIGAVQSFPECPLFTGALTELAEALFPSLPTEFKQWGLMVRWGLLRSGLDRLENEPHLQPRFYCCLVSLPNRGKTGCINESRESLDLIVKMTKARTDAHNSSKPIPWVFANVETVNSVDSGQYLVQAFYDQAKKANKSYQDYSSSEDRAKILLDPDELSDLFMKAQVTNSRNSTIFSELLKLHSGNRTGNGTKKDGDLSVDNAHLAILAGTTVEKYPLLWMGTGGGGDGLISRFMIITTNNPQVPPVPLASDADSIATLYDKLSKLLKSRQRTIRLSDDAGQILARWWNSFDNSKKSATRILELVKQTVIVLAVTNLPEDNNDEIVVVSGELMRQATKFGDYEIQVRERLNPDDSWTLVQGQENKILTWMKKHSSKMVPKSKNDCRRGVTPHKLPGGLAVFNQAWRACVESEMVKLREQGRKGALYSL
jgi:hypothetical protein